MRVLSLCLAHGALKAKASFSADHKTGDGRLISSQKTRKFSLIGNWYDGWRVDYCERHRNSSLPSSFREGRLTPYTLLVSVVLRISDRNYKNNGCSGG